MLDKLEFLLILARERHFGRAAETAGVTQPTLSSAIKSLEENLGTALVERGSRFRGFTPEGERVLEWARRLVGDARTMRQESLKGSLSGHLRIGAIPTALSVSRWPGVCGPPYRMRCGFSNSPQQRFAIARVALRQKTGERRHWCCRPEALAGRCATAATHEQAEYPRCD